MRNMIKRTIPAVAIGAAVITTVWAFEPEAGATSGSITLTCGHGGTAVVANTRTAEQWPHAIHVWVHGGGVVPLGPLDSFAVPLDGTVTVGWGDDTASLSEADCATTETTAPPPTTTPPPPTTVVQPTTTTTPQSTTTVVQPTTTPQQTTTTVQPATEVSLTTAELPATGGQIEALAGVGILTALAGGVSLLLGRRT